MVHNVISFPRLNDISFRMKPFTVTLVYVSLVLLYEPMPCLDLNVGISAKMGKNDAQ